MNEIKKVEVRKCPKCDGFIPIEDFVKKECFRLSDFKKLTKGNEDLIIAEDVFHFNHTDTLEVFQCPECEDLFEEFTEKSQKMWDTGFDEYFKTKKEAEDA